MNKTVRRTAAVLALLFVVAAGLQAQSMPLSETKYDYSEVAAQITEGCTSRYDKAKAIYRWLAAHIAYDTTYSIYTADGCWEQKRGVCQAYCELFARLAECVGVRTYIIAGKSKDLEGNVSGAGHAWLFVVTSGESTGILVDPTWGAGSVNGGVFTRNEADDMSWFDVRPEWLVFSHFPDDAQWQLLARPLSWEEFRKIPPLRPYLASYGMDGAALLSEALAGQTDLPQFYKAGMGKVALLAFPKRSRLRVGRAYRFEVGLYGDYEIALINGQEFLKRSAWRVEEDRLVVDYVPQEGGDVSLSVKGPDGMYHTVVEYVVPRPDAADLAALERLMPEAMPELKRLANYDAEDFKAVGIDARKMLAAVRSGQVDAAPDVYRYDGFPYRVVSAPLGATLLAGQTYTFALRLPSPCNLAAITPDGWLREWHTDEEGVCSLTVVPQTAGKLSISADYRSNGKFYPLLQYQVR